MPPSLVRDWLERTSSRRRYASRLKAPRQATPLRLHWERSSDGVGWARARVGEVEDGRFGRGDDMVGKFD